jgi:drug/metabolite transporter (DMT)-like permease
MAVAAASSAAHSARDEMLAYAGLGVSTLGWASAFIVGKWVLAEMTPLPAAAWRYAFAATVLLPFAIRQRPRAGLRGSAVPLAVMTICGGIFYPWLFLQALSLTSATNTSLLIALNPALTVLLSPLIGERLGVRRLGGVGLALLGAGTVITRGDLAVLRSLSLNTGDLLAVGGAMGWAAFNLASRRVMAHLTPAFVNCFIYSFGGMALAVLGHGDHPVLQLVSASPTAVGGIIAMALLSSVVAGQLFLVGVRTIGVGRTVVFVYLVPVVTAALSAAFLGERLILAQAIGGAAVLAGVALTARIRA